MTDERNNALQALCREYLGRLRYMAKKHGLGGFVVTMIRENKAERCKATEKEVNMLARLCDDERISRKDVPKVLEKSYRDCCDDNDFEHIKRLKHQGLYSKVSALLLKAKKQ